MTTKDKDQTRSDQPQPNSIADLRGGEWCLDCRAVGALHCAHPEECDGMRPRLPCPCSSSACVGPQIVAGYYCKRAGEIATSIPDMAGTEPRPNCAGCGGPHQFDTSVSSVIWNRVIRYAGLPDYLCLSCIVRAFARHDDGTSFTAVLYSDELHGVPIEIQFDGDVAKDAQSIQEENNAVSRPSQETR